MEPGVLAGAMPGVGHPPAELPSIRAAAIGTVVDLTGDDASADVAFPIRDLDVPDPGRMVEILDAIDRHRPGGVYVHCLAGIGRTGTVIGCWLVRHGLETPATVLDGIARRRSADPVSGRVPSPETPAQRALVTGWRPGT